MCLTIIDKSLQNFLFDIDLTFRSRVLCKMKKEQREKKASEEKTSGELSSKINELKCEMDELKSVLSQMKCELGAKMDSIIISLREAHGTRTSKPPENE